MAVVQDLRYTYDPAGNITRVEDEALSTIFYDGQLVEPACDYRYDAIYRLIEATGREHIGQTAHDFDPPSRRDYDLVGFAGFTTHPNDLQAMRRYTERYGYDAVGNLQFIRHISNGDSWTRAYQYNEDSLTEPGKQSNRLSRTMVGNSFNHTENYNYSDADGHDVQGCLTALNTMQMDWDFKDQLAKVILGGGGTAYYVYDASGQRVRKVIELQNGTPSEERLYLGAFEIYRRFGANGLNRETLHVMDDKRRIVVVETKTHEFGSQLEDPQSIARYQLVNHLASTSLELDKDGGLISYEEYHPYGTTAFQAMSSAAEVSLKRYCYTGKERDEESGFYYHGARYYAPWLGRWTSADPIGIADGPNVYAYVAGRVIKASDPSGYQKTDEVLNAAVEVPSNERLKAAGEGLLFGTLMTAKILYEMYSSGPVGTANAPRSAEEPRYRATTDTDLAMNFAAGVALNVFVGRVVAPIVANEIRIAAAETAAAPKQSAPALPAKETPKPSAVPTGPAKEALKPRPTPAPRTAVAAAPKEPIPTVPAKEAAKSSVSPPPPVAAPRSAVVIQGTDAADIERYATAHALATGRPIVRLGPETLAGVDEATLVAHGDVSGIDLGRSYANTTTGLVTPRELANRLVESGWRGGTLRLGACSTGVPCPTSGLSYAEELSQNLAGLGAPTATIGPKGVVGWEVPGGSFGLPTVGPSANVTIDAGGAALANSEFLSPGKGWKYFSY
jgi:RHS repeat-associated protein